MLPATLLDRLFTGGLLFLILFTPFAFGAVQPWAYITMEVVIFALVIVWMGKRALLAGEHRAGSSTNFEFRNSNFELFRFAIPLMLFLALVGFQLIPLPPSLLKIISPQTFETYRQILPGWPEREPYGELGSMEQGAGSTEQGATGEGSWVSGVGLTGNAPDAKNAPNAAREGQRAKIASQPEPQNLTPNTQKPARGLFPETWLPLSLSSNLSKIDLLRFAAFAALFFSVWRYPFEKPFEDFGFPNSDPGFFILSPEQRFLRAVIFAVLGTGLLVAAFGFVERFPWNGKILLFVAGYDSRAVARASGPFINPDHFANYLSLIFPLALGAALFRTFMVSKANQYGLTIFCAFTGFLLFTGILLSLSRAGWMNALLGVVVLVWLAPWGGARQRAKRKKQRQNRIPNTQHRQPESASRLTPHAFARVARLSLITVFILLIVSLFFAGESGREKVDARLEETLERDMGFAGRVTAWKDSLGMIRDFPLIGVGLGAWGDVFKRYESGPWSSEYFNEAHNDYIEILAETGVVGFGLLAWFFVGAGRRLTQGIKKISSKNIPVLAAILSALAGMALHSWLDFSLQIPANALLFTVLLALGMRLVNSREQGARSVARSEWSPVPGLPSAEISLERGAWSRDFGQRSEVRRQRSVSRLFALSPLLRAAGSLPLSGLRSPVTISALALALIGCAVTQEEEAPRPQSVAEAKERLLARPFKASYHLSVIRRMEEDAPLEWRLREYRAAHWIQPTNPYIRDQIAATLTALGRTDEALKEMSQSVAHAPSLERHEYLSAEALPQLSAQEQDAVEKGFKQALSWDYPEALNGLAEFYARLERFADQAALYEQAALNKKDNAKKVELLINGGLAYLRAERREQGARSREQGAKREALAVTGQMSAGSAEQGAGSQQRGNARSPSSVPGRSDQLPAPSSMLHAAAAERLLRAAIAAGPADPKPYHHLLAMFAAREDLEGAKRFIADGIKSGAPPLPLYLSLAEAAHKGGNPDESKAALEAAEAEVQKGIRNGESPHTLYMALADGARRAGDRDEESAALLKALERQPRSPETLMRLAHVYSGKRNYDRAAMYLNRVAAVTPNAADLFYRIAQTEEARYRFADAGRAYARAIELAPGDARYKERYEAFQARVAANASERDAKVANSKSP
jgi:O-antigen ligase/Flp pilus assembly protein TadD